MRRNGACFEILRHSKISPYHGTIPFWASERNETFSKWSPRKNFAIGILYFLVELKREAEVELNLHIAILKILKRFRKNSNSHFNKKNRSYDTWNLNLDSYSGFQFQKKFKIRQEEGIVRFSMLDESNNPSETHLDRFDHKRGEARILIERVDRYLPPHASRVRGTERGAGEGKLVSDPLQRRRSRTRFPVWWSAEWTTTSGVASSSPIKREPEAGDRGGKVHADKELPAPQTIQRLEKQVNRNSLRELLESRNCPFPRKRN